MAATISIDELASDTLDAFKVLFPMLGQFTTDFSRETAKFNDTITGTIDVLPTVRDYDGTTGYQANAAESKDLAVNVPVVLNRHKHVPTKVDYIDQISSKKDLYGMATRQRAFALGKSIVDYLATLILDANFSQNSIFSVANSDLDMVINVAEDMNGVGASPFGRIGLVNSAVMSTLQADSRIASKDYYGELGRGTAGAYGVIRGVAGFEAIYEWPGLPGNSENLTAFFCTREAFILAARVPDKIANPSAAMDQIAVTSVVSDAATGLAFGGIEWCNPGTFDDFMTLALLYGAKAGSQGGADGAITDYAGHRVVTA